MTGAHWIGRWYDLFYTGKVNERGVARFRHFSHISKSWNSTSLLSDIASGIAARMASTGNRVNAFDKLITGIALFHHAGAIITADTDFMKNCKLCGY